MTAIRWGMIGVGSVAEHKSGPAFAKAAGGRLVAVAARRHDAAAAFAQRHGIAHAFASVDQLIESPDVDAVYIATPPSSHAALALAVAQAGKPCCVEKPMSVQLADAEAMVAAFARAGTPLFVSYYRRSLPRFAFIRDLLASGVIGTVSSVDWILQRPAPATINDNWRLDPHEAPGGLFEDLACHGLDLFDYLLGAISSVKESKLRISPTLGVPDRVDAKWRHGDTIEGHGTWDFNAPERADRACIAGSEGSIRFSVFDESPVQVASRAGSESTLIANPVPIQLPHVANLNRALLQGVAHPSTGDSALRTAIVSAAILRGG